MTRFVPVIKTLKQQFVAYLTASFSCLAIGKREFCFGSYLETFSCWNLLETFGMLKNRLFLTG